MARNRRLIRELMIWVALVALGLGALSMTARQKAEAAREAVRRAAEWNERRAVAPQPTPAAPNPVAASPSDPR